MSLNIATHISLYLVSLFTLIEGLENWSISKNSEFLKTWQFDLLVSDLKRGLPLPKQLIVYLFQDGSFKYIALLQIILAFINPLFTHWFILLILLILHVLVCIRFRGIFNGGSDMMAVVVMTGLIINLANISTTAQNLGLIYIAIHGVYSYFKAGLVKIRDMHWRQGTSIAVFFSQSLYPDVRYFANWLDTKPQLCKYISWSIIIFELSALAIPIFPAFALSFFFMAMSFHFLNYLAFGLNRFFWTWLSAWPAIIYTVSLVSL